LWESSFSNQAIFYKPWDPSLKDPFGHFGGALKRTNNILNPDRMVCEGEQEGMQGHQGPSDRSTTIPPRHEYALENLLHCRRRPDGNNHQTSSLGKIDSDAYERIFTTIIADIKTDTTVQGY
jgi:hypothetical protein